MAKKLKRGLLIILGILAALVVAVLFLDRYAANKPQKNNGTGANITSDQRLAGPDLLYAYLYSAGLCSNSKGEKGGCYAEYYLYVSGKLIYETGFVAANGKREALPGETNLSKDATAEISKRINDSGVLNMDCPSQMIMDAGWDYHVNLNGENKFYRNPPPPCKKVFEDINSMVNVAAGAEIIN